MELVGVEVVETSSDAYKSSALTVVLHSHIATLRASWCGCAIFWNRTCRPPSGKVNYGAP